MKQEDEKIEKLSKKLKLIEEEAWEEYCRIREEKGDFDKLSIQSMKNTIGSKNTEYAHCDREEYGTAEDFIAAWINGLIESNKDKKTILFEMMKVPVCKEYIYLFLERNYYRQYNARIRYKSPKSLETIWFGDNAACWGLFISPVQRNGKWTNDNSEIRRANYNYWTLGHVINVGFVTNRTSEPLKIERVEELIVFYNKFFAEKSKSIYEKKILKMYFEYLRGHSDDMEMPLLIPEFRFDGAEVCHKYRLDFVLFNVHTRRFTGFEISPQSTHIPISVINSLAYPVENIQLEQQEVRKSWEREMDKRNQYWEKYDISVVTFTDKELTDLDKCFDVIRGYIEERKPAHMDLELQEARLKKMQGLSVISESS